MKHKLIAASVAAVCLTPAQAETGGEIEAIRRQLQELRQTYEARIDALERRLAAAEARTPQAPAQAAPAGRQRDNTFNPGISLILQGRYAGLSRDPAAYHIRGSVPPGDEVGPGKRGLSLAETELIFSANVDPYFSGVLVGAIAPDGGIEAENAYLQTLRLPHGLTLKAGRFFSRIGYHNEQHPHAWDFVDAPLPYRAFLDGQLGDDGVQLKWVAPTDLFVELGMEAGRGRSFPGSDANRNGAALGTLFAHVGGDVGASSSWRAGVSYVRASPRDRRYDDPLNGVANAFTGRSELWVADLVWKWAPQGNATYRNLKLQAEVLRRRERGTLNHDPDGLALSDAFSSRQSGWYAQAVYQFMPKWRVGGRLARLSTAQTRIGLVDSGVLAAADFPVLQPYRPSAGAAMIDWSPSEFSRLRLQFAEDRSRPGLTGRQLFLQYILSLGQHGAHSW